jgi:hypothetical protein
MSISTYTCVQYWHSTAEQIMNERVGTDKLGVAFAVAVAGRSSEREGERRAYVWDMGPGEQVMYINIMAVPRMTAEGYSLVGWESQLG